jgi:hypothetical protein
MKILTATLVSLSMLVGFQARAQVARTPPVFDPSNYLNPPAGESAGGITRPVVTLRPRLLAHNFLDFKNSMAMASVAVSLAGDGWSTDRALTLPGAHEMNPLARPFVSSRAGEAAYFGTSFALVAAGLYLAHKTNHHKLERVGPYALAGWEGLLTGWNLHQASRAR